MSFRPRDRFRFSEITPASGIRIRELWERKTGRCLERVGSGAGVQ